MALVELSEKIYFDSNEFASVQEEIVHEYSNRSPSDTSMHVSFEGSVVTLKNGRKIFVRGMTPKEIIEKLRESL